MDGFVDLKEAVKMEEKGRVDSIEKLSGISAFTLLGTATWLAWPALQSAMDGGPLITGLGYSLIILAWGIFVQDLGQKGAFKGWSCCYNILATNFYYCVGPT
jgi:thiol:disulfide interchange protein